MNKYILIFGIMVLISSVSQILLKISANKIYENKIKEVLNPLVITSYSIFFGVMYFNTILLKYINLKYVAVIESTGYIYILILAAIILKEEITKRKIIGNLIIILGIIVFNLR